MKLCKRCGKNKTLDCFYRSLEKEARCKECVSELRKEKYKENRQQVIARVRKYRTENPEKIRDLKLRQAYKITAEEYDKKHNQQNGVCAACGKPEKTVWRGRVVRLAVDHNHQTGQIRGLLCMFCNRALGLLMDDIKIISGLLKYRKKY